MRLSTRSHAALDFAAVGFLFVAPRLFGASERLKKATTAFALTKLGVSLLTRYEGGVVGVVPMKAHLAIDAAAGVALATLPLLSEEAESTGAAACCVVAALIDVAAAAVTDPQPRPLRIPGLNASVTTRLPGED